MTEILKRPKKNIKYCEVSEFKEVEFPKENEQIRFVTNKAKSTTDFISYLADKKQISEIIISNSAIDNKSIDKIIKSQGKEIQRINASHCLDMLASQKQRDKIALEVSDGKRVWWLTPGWLLYRHSVFQDWDNAMANENFPQHSGGAIILDGIGFWDKYSETHPEKILEFSDWMGIQIQPYEISLDRFKDLLLERIH